MVPSLCPKSSTHFYKHMELSIAGRHHCGLKQMARLNARTVHCLKVGTHDATSRRVLVASSHGASSPCDWSLRLVPATGPCDWSLRLVAGTSCIVCADLKVIPE